MNGFLIFVFVSSVGGAGFDFTPLGFHSDVKVSESRQEIYKVFSMEKCHEGIKVVTEKLSEFSDKVNKIWTKEFVPALDLTKVPTPRDCQTISEEDIQQIWFLATAPIEPVYRKISIDATLEFFKKFVGISQPKKLQRQSSGSLSARQSTPRGENRPSSAKAKTPTVSGFDGRICSWYRTPFVEQLKKGETVLSLTQSLVEHLRQAQACLNPPDLTSKTGTPGSTQEVPRTQNTKEPLDTVQLQTLMRDLTGQDNNKKAAAAEALLVAYMPDRYTTSNELKPDLIDKLKKESPEGSDYFRKPCEVEVPPRGENAKKKYLARVRYFEAVILCAGESLDILRGFDRVLEMVSLRQPQPGSCELESFHFLSSALADMLHTGHIPNWDDKRNAIPPDPDQWSRSIMTKLECMDKDCPLKVFLTDSIWRAILDSGHGHCSGDKDSPLQHATTFVDRATSVWIARKLIMLAAVSAFKAGKDVPLEDSWEHFYSRFNVNAASERRAETNGVANPAQSYSWPDIYDYDAVGSRDVQLNGYLSEESQKKAYLKVDVFTAEKALLEHRRVYPNAPSGWQKRLSYLALHVLAALPKCTIYAARLLLGLIDERDVQKYNENAYKRDREPDWCKVTGKYAQFEEFEKKYRTRFTNFLLPLYMFLVKWYSCGEGITKEYLDLLLKPMSVKEFKQKIKKNKCFPDIKFPGPKPETPAPAPPVNNDPPPVITEPEPEVSEPAFKFQEELEDYVNKLTMAGIPGTEAATRVQVQASLAELAQRVLEEMEKLDEMEKDCDAKIKSTFQEMKKVVKGTKKTGDGSGLQGSGDIGKTNSGTGSGKET